MHLLSFHFSCLSSAATAGSDPKMGQVTVVAIFPQPLLQLLPLLFEQTHILLLRADLLLQGPHHFFLQATLLLLQADLLLQHSILFSQQVLFLGSAYPKPKSVRQANKAAYRAG